ncbi:unnamed protein product, partial [Gulo gulo]
VPRCCRTARPPACRPFRASVGESPVLGAEPAAVPAASSSSPFPSPPSHTPFPIPAPSPSRPPHSGQECPARNNLAAPRWLWSRSSGRLPPAPPPAPAPRKKKILVILALIKSGKKLLPANDRKSTSYCPCIFNDRHFARDQNRRSVQ